MHDKWSHSSHCHERQTVILNFIDGPPVFHEPFSQLIHSRKERNFQVLDDFFFFKVQLISYHTVLRAVIENCTKHS